MSIFQQLARSSKEDFLKARRGLQQESRKFTEKFELVHENPLNAYEGSAKPVKGWRNRNFLAAIYFEGNDAVRLSVNRTELQNDGNWKGDITWDELMEVKRGIGMGDGWMVEIFPPDSEVVNVANMRHLWITGQPAFAWTKAKKESAAQEKKPGTIAKVMGLLKGGRK